jgi:DNA uptake protein ComE-like DNA-binding protein
MHRLLAGLAAVLIAMPALAQAPATPRPTAPSTTTPSTRPAPSGSLIDINTASAEELDKLPGVGKARADAIIKNRPYRSKDELESRHIIPSNVYNEIKDRIIARQH